MEKFAINYIYQILKKFIIIIRSIVWIIMNNHMILLLNLYIEFIYLNLYIEKNATFEKD